MRLAISKAKSKKPKKKTAVLNVDGVDVPVTFNTTGRLDKKSQKAFNEVLNKKLQSGLASRFSMSQGVEALGFAGLVGLNYYGVDLLSMFLGDFIGTVAEVVETAKEGLDLIGEALGAVGAVIFTGDLTVFGNAGITANGMPKDVVKKVVGNAGELQAANIDKAIAVQKFRIKFFEGKVSDEQIQKLRDELKTLEDPEPEVGAAKDKALADKIDRELKTQKIIIAIGMAYAEKKFLESYTLSQAVENIPIVQ